MLQQSKTSFISIYAQFKSAIRPQFKLILIIHFSGLWQKEKNKKTKKLFRGQRSPGRLLKTKRKFIITFFLWHLALKFMILLMIRSSFLHKLRAFMWLHNFFGASGKKIIPHSFFRLRMKRVRFTYCLSSPSTLSHLHPQKMQITKNIWSKV